MCASLCGGRMILTRIVAVVPIATTACPGAARDCFAVAALETLEPSGALRIRVTLSSTCLQVGCTIIVSTRQHAPAAVLAM